MDLVIIGAGPAGLTAAIYAKRFGIDCIILDNPEQLSQLTLAHKVNNYPGFEDISGTELLNKMQEHAKKAGAEIKQEKVVDIQDKKVITDNGSYDTKSILIATGAKHRKANIPGESEFLGKGVSYCALCDGAFFKGKDVVVIGGSQHTESTVNVLKDMGVNVVAVLEKVNEIKGTNFVESVIADGKEIKCNAVFIAIGEVPTVELVKKIGVNVDENNFIIVDEDQKTNVPGVYAAGDVTNNKLKQVVNACGDGAIAVFAINKFLKR